MESRPRVSVVIPTFLRDECLVGTLEYLLGQDEPPDEIVIVDQTPQHTPAVEGTLKDLQQKGKLRWVRQETPNASLARNRGAAEARFDVLLYLDDDIIPSPTLVRDHRRHYESDGVAAVAGQVFYEPKGVRGDFPVEQRERLARSIAEAEPVRTGVFAGCNFSVRRSTFLGLGGFDENFLPPGYCEESDFAQRLVKANHVLVADPSAWIIHLAVPSGGHRLVGSRFPRWQVSLGYFIFAFRHAREPAAFTGFFWKAMRAGPLRRYEVCRPWRWAGGVAHFAVAMFEGWRRAHRGVDSMFWRHELGRQ